MNHIFKISCLGLCLCFGVSLFAGEDQDSVDQMFIGLDPEGRVELWKSWYADIDHLNPTIWELKQDQACTDVYKAFSAEEAKVWCFDLKIQFAKDLLFHNFRSKAENVFGQLKNELDSLSDLNKSQKALHVKWNTAYGAARFYKFQEVDSASVYFQNAEKLVETLDDPMLKYTLWKEQGIMRLYTGEGPQALASLNKIKTLDLKLKVEEQLNLRVLMARALSQSQQYQLADVIYENLLDSIQFLDTFNNIRYQIAYAEHLCRNKKKNKAYAIFDKLMPELDGLKIIPLIKDFSDEACRCYSKNRDFDKCQFTYSEYRSNFNQNVVKERKQIIANWEERLESSKKKAQIKNLQQEERIENNQFRFRLAGIIGGGLLAGLVLFYFLKRNRNKRRALALSIQKNKEITENRDKLFSAITHDIRTPLALMMAPLERAETQVVDTQAKQDLQLARRSGKRLMELFNQILDWNKAEAQAMTLNPQAGRLAFTLQSLGLRFLDQAKEKGIVFNSEILLSEGQYVLDYDKMDKVLSNLVGNAIKFCDKNETVKLKADWNADQLTLSIHDSGPGISEKDQAKLFDRHYQGDQGKLKGGTGIGLALVHDLVQMMNGRISVHSELGTGTTFTVVLPVIRLEEKTIATQKDVLKTEKRLNSVDQEKPMILIVEDDPELMKFIASTINKDYHVKVANSCSTGLSIALSQIPDMIISDWSLPDYDGGWLCRKIRANELTSHIPVMILTAFTSDENLKSVFDSGAIARMNKPFRIDALHDQIKNILEQQNQIQNNWSKDTTAAQKVDESSSSKDTFLNKAFNVLDLNLHDQGFAVEQMASILELSRSQLFRKLKNTTGYSPSQLLSIRRLEAAQKLLQNTKQSIADIAIAVGFSDPSYLSNAYKKHFSYSPKEEKRPKS